MTDERRAALEPLMMAVTDYGDAKGQSAIAFFDRGTVRLVARTPVEQAAVAFAIAILERQECGLNWEDGRACTFTDIGLEDACLRCTELLEWRSIAEEMRR